MKPNCLKKGDTIAVIAPSNPVREEDKKILKETEKKFNSVGINVVYAKNIYSNSLRYGATPQEKAEDLNWAFQNKDIKGIFCARGGENSNSLFEYIDYDIIKKNPKVFCGFSDSTSLINMIYEKTGLVAYHSSTFKAISDWDNPAVFQDIIGKLMEGKSNLTLGNEQFYTIKKGKGEGILIGGNLSCISRMVCGKYCIDFENKILFIEDLGEESNPRFVSSFLYYMKQNQVFSKIKGLWIGSYEHQTSVSIENIVEDVLQNEYDFPIIKSNNFGHIDMKMTIPVGIRAKIDTEIDGKIVLQESCINLCY